MNSVRRALVVSATGAAVVLAGAVLWGLRMADHEIVGRQQMYGSPSSVFYALAQRCIDWVEGNPEPGSIDEFQFSGLKGAPFDDLGYPVFSDEAEQVFVTLRPSNETQFNCLIDDRSEPWSESEREEIETIAFKFAPGFVTEPYESVDLRNQGDFMVAQAFRTTSGIGNSIVVFRGKQDDGRPYTTVIIGHGDRTKGGEDA